MGVLGRDPQASYRDEVRALFGGADGEDLLILAFAQDGTVNWASDPLLALLGHTSADFDGSAIDWDGMTPPEYWTLDDRCIGQLEQRDMADPYVKELLHKNGTRVAVRVRVARSLAHRTRLIMQLTELSAHSDR
jgi:hypothetical protein